MRSLLLLLSIALTTAAAPAPRYKPKQLTPGRYMLSWSHVLYNVNFEEGGQCTLNQNKGNWRWCPRERVLEVYEDMLSGTPCRWIVVLDDELCGRAKLGHNNLTAEIKITRR